MKYKTTHNYEAIAAFEKTAAIACTLSFSINFILEEKILIWKMRKLRKIITDNLGISEEN